MNEGTVKFFNNASNKLFGFIKSDDGGGDIFFHFNNGPEGNSRMPQKGDRLIFDVERSARGPKAAKWVFEGQELVVELPSWSGEAPALNPILSKNLESFGLEDIMVTGTIDVLRDHEKTVVQLGPMHLSQMCGYVRRTIKKRLSDQCSLDILVFQNGTPIGKVDSDHRFHYIDAPDLRTALGWIFATDLGHTKLLSVGLDSAVKGLKTIISKAPLEGSQEEVWNFCSGAFLRQLSQTIVANRTSRFADGHFGPLNLLWAIGTQEVHGRVLSYGHRFMAH